MLERIRAARAALPGQVRRTPILPSPQGWWHCENLQTTGSYKLRAAFHVLQSLSPEERQRGAALTSSGNFAQAFAYAGAALGIPTYVVMMEKTQPFKIERTRALGGQVVLCENRFDARFETLRALADERGVVAIDHMEDERVIIGHATVGLDLIESVQPRQVLVPVSTAGLLAGVAVAVKAVAPQTRVIGVQPEGSDATARSFRAGEIVSIGEARTCCDALTASRPGGLPFRLLQRYVDDVVTVTEHSIEEAVRYMVEEAKLVVEPGGAVGVAALRSGVVGGPAAVLLSGGNIAPDRLAALLRSG